jgi:hypothetical protein
MKENKLTGFSPQAWQNKRPWDKYYHEILRPTEDYAE